ncbi:hypothetical protein EJ377_01490 [Chryseobacterium arthrosphaerae]|uniref:Beta-lactamase-related domain-containing protein n=1 Tax=Chryseobacterium arthrosphaerae TaxID=651561 RepID=A0A3S0QHX4_9FLAO|nr:hypothetical protein EJ377_01490 [Chryseobacterium arthrosphaerae]
MAVIKLNGKLNYWHGGNNLGYTSSFMIDPDKKFGYVYFTNEDQCNGMKKSWKISVEVIKDYKISVL